MADQRFPLLVLMGPTAAGKTDLALALAERLPVRIISVDSVMVYRGLDIGTAKPDAATLARYPHRLIDIRDPAETYSAAQFRSDALREIRAARAAGRLPLLVGGTMLYFRALLEGLSSLPAADAEIRHRLEQARRDHGLAALHARLAAVDPDAAARIHPHDTQRIQRALEIFELTGRPMSHQLNRRVSMTADETPPLHAVKWVVAPTERDWLHRRIAQRFHRMLEQGFIGEIERLRGRGDLSPEQPALRAVGYRQVWDYLAGAYDREAMIEKAIQATRRFAKRQLTWLRRESAAHWLDSRQGDLVDRIMEQLKTSNLFTNH